MVFCFVQNFFSDNTRVKLFIILSRQARIFSPEFNIRLYDKNSESYYFFFLHQHQNLFFSNIGNQNILLEKTHNPPPPLQVKWSFPQFNNGPLRCFVHALSMIVPSLYRTPRPVSYNLYRMGVFFEGRVILIVFPKYISFLMKLIMYCNIKKVFHLYKGEC